MSLKLMQGFDSMGNDQDFRTQGWFLPGNSATYGGVALFGPSSTGVPGRALRPLSTAWAATAQNDDSSANTGGGNDCTIGYYNMGITNDQAWSAGGFAMGGTAKLWNTPVILNSTRRQMGYDPQNDVYYVIMGAQVYWSPDLTTWTVCTAQPPGVTSSWGNTFSYMGNGIMMFCPALNQTAMTVYYTSNHGATWTAQTIGTLPSAAQYYGIGCATGNSTYPMMINIGGSASTAVNGIYVGTLGGTFVLAKNLTQGYQGSTGVIGVPGITSSGLLYHLTNGAISSIQNVTTANLSLAANWTVTTGFDGSMYDLQFYPAANKWIAASGANGFIYSLVNPGTQTNPLAPTSGTSTTITLAGSAATTYSMNVLVTNGGQNCIVTGGAGPNSSSMYAYSTDGVTWQTKFTVQPNNNVAYQGLGLAGQQSSFYTAIIGKNGRVVKIGISPYPSYGSTYIASSPDGVSGWVVNYVTDAQNPGTTGLYKGFGFRASTTTPVSGSTWTPAGSGAFFNAAQGSGSTATISFYNGVAAASSSTTVPWASTMTPQQLTHWFELVATPTATANTFNIGFYIDGQLKYTLTSIAVGSASGQPLIMIFPRSQYMCNFDDLYVTLQDGTNTVAPLGAWNIQAPALTSDAQAQWTKSGTAASNAVTVNTALSQATGYVSTSTDGAKDEYNTAGITGNYKVRAVQNETYVEAQAGAPSVSIGILSGSTELDGSAITANTLNYQRAFVLSEKDPNGNIAWTQTSANAAKVVVNKIS